MVFPGDMLPAFGKIALYRPGTRLGYRIPRRLTTRLEAPDRSVVDGHGLG
ncbi:MAG: hypothetical protein AVDCRST_MAG26-1313 [uncultured Chloroflexia bacterium]|uniref:Uncharacterized protein n=1 Tax=uncultured Chloroflexia bacterium TaxID=1672391 RepID=A0A6J4I2B8_9CHLR|nr:MAG: hypothetical protein AVDCRST_MAG26-1313 [uncultured Chloroflexia bacterium]